MHEMTTKSTTIENIATPRARVCVCVCVRVRVC